MGCVSVGKSMSLYCSYCSKKEFFASSYSALEACNWPLIKSMLRDSVSDLIACVKPSSLGSLDVPRWRLVMELENFNSKSMYSLPRETNQQVKSELPIFHHVWKWQGFSKIQLFFGPLSRLYLS